jgi:hypothetical protein
MMRYLSALFGLFLLGACGGRSELSLPGADVLSFVLENGKDITSEASALEAELTKEIPHDYKLMSVSQYLTLTKRQIAKAATIDNRDEFSGLCLITASKENIIVLRDEVWADAKEDYRFGQSVFLHEIGHCIYGLKHVDDEDNIMHAARDIVDIFAEPREPSEMLLDAIHEAQNYDL